jgi:dipeptidyl aminopeptidase/acylaminoacyl peptidase
VTDATRWAIEQGIADPQRVCIMGASYGGYAALEGAVKEPDLYRCAIGNAGVYDLKLWRGATDVRLATSGGRYMSRVIGDDDEAMTQHSPLYQLDRLKAKVMLIAGGEDKRVPPEQAMALHTALEKRGVQHEYVYERTEGHGFYDETHQAQLYTKLLAFLDANIGAGSDSKK